MTYEEFRNKVNNGLLKWSEEDSSYHDASGKRYDAEGEELINAVLDNDFKDVAKLRARENPKN